MMPLVTRAIALTLLACAFSLVVPVAGAQEKDMITTETGLQYRVEKEGTGQAATDGDVVTVHYTGTLTDGTKFDSSRDRGQPFSFRLGRSEVIAGWDQGVAGMKVGERRTLVIPSELGYGERGAGQDIPPGATLHFDVELVATSPALAVAVTRQGEGETADAGEFVTVHYTGTLKDGGTKFDSSRDRGEPFRFALGAGEVIAGWDEGVAGMKVGERRTLTINSALGYGQRGAPPVIPPDADLVFDVELLKVEPGVTYKTTQEGQGEVLDAGEWAQVQMKMTADGNVIADTSKAGGAQAIPMISQVEPRALMIGAIGMKVGEKRTVKAPANWARYQRNSLARQTLLIELELVEIGEPQGE